MRVLYVLAMVFVACCSSCTPVTPEPVAPTTPEQEAGCAESCARGRQLRCDWASDGPGRDGELGTADDATCEAVCLDYERRGIAMHNSCVAAAKSCLAADLCME